MSVQFGLVLALAIGAAGGAVFNAVDAPLPWMLGSMAFSTIAALLGAPIRLPSRLRSGLAPVLGVMLGTSFTPAVVARMGAWLVTILCLVAWSIVITALCWAWLRYRAGYDRITAFFAATPGGVNEMTIVGGQMGGDERTIALTHATRVIIVVFTIPIWFRLHAEIGGGGNLRSWVSLSAIDLADLAVLALCAVGGAVGARRLRLPAAMVMGPMILSAIAHLAGLTDAAPPSLVVAVAQVVIGTAVGCRFVGTPLRFIGHVFGHAVITASVMLVVTVATANLLAHSLDMPLAALLLAFAPGGLAEMSLVALALQVDAAFVATHHIARIVLVTTLAPLIFRTAIRD